jgi:hypothetical protein
MIAAMWLRYILVVGFAVSSLSFPVGKLPGRSQLPFSQASTLAILDDDSARSEPRLARLIRRCEAGPREIGVAIVSLTSDSLVLAHNATAAMVPASNQKLLITASAWPEWSDGLVAGLSVKPAPVTAKPARSSRTRLKRRGKTVQLIEAAVPEATAQVPSLYDFPQRDSLTGLAGYDVLCRIHKWSDNRLANRVLKNLVARHRTDGQEIVQRYLDSLGIWTGGLNIVDGSGRSPGNRIAPLTIAHVLRAMYHAPKHESYISSLARAGTEGTLRRQGLGLGSEVSAKTGSINGTFSLSGYLFGQHDTFAFSILLNNWYEKAAAFRFFGELLCALDQRPAPTAKRSVLAGTRHRTRSRKGVT